MQISPAIPVASFCPQQRMSPVAFVCGCVVLVKGGERGSGDKPISRLHTLARTKAPANAIIQVAAAISCLISIINTRHRHSIAETSSQSNNGHKSFHMPSVWSPIPKSSLRADGLACGATAENPPKDWKFGSEMQYFILEQTLISICCPPFFRFGQQSVCFVNCQRWWI